MISVSQLAASVMWETLEASKIKSGYSFRLVRNQEQFTLSLDKPSRKDRVVRYQGNIILIVDKVLEIELGRARVYVDEGSKGNELILRRSGNPVGLPTILVTSLDELKSNGKISKNWRENYDA